MSDNYHDFIKSLYNRKWCDDCQRSLPQNVVCDCPIDTLVTIADKPAPTHTIPALDEEQRIATIVQVIERIAEIERQVLDLTARLDAQDGGK